MLTNRERKLLENSAFIKKVCENRNLYVALGNMATCDADGQAYITDYLVRILRGQAKSEADPMLAEREKQT